jgi:hypothetical protein
LDGCLNEILPFSICIKLWFEWLTWSNAVSDSHDGAAIVESSLLVSFGLPFCQGWNAQFGFSC